MNTLWLFGDSFTQSLSGKNLNYTKIIGVESFNTWYEIVANRLDYEPKVFARGGKSTPTIVNDIINNLDNFKPNDMIIAQSSIPTRIIGMNNHFGTIETLNTEYFAVFEKLDIEDTYDHTYGIDIDKKNAQLLLDYTLKFILPHEKHWDLYYKNQIINLLKFINKSIGTKTLFWSHLLYDMFLSIAEETNYKIDDGHWGMRGQSAFAEHLIERIKRQEWFYDPLLLPKKLL